MLATIAAFTLMLDNPAAGDGVERRIIMPPSGKVASMTPREAADKCTKTLEATEKSGALDLLVGSGACSKISRAVQASFLFNIGIIRGGTDVSLLIPATKIDSNAQYDLMLSLYYGAGNVGSDEVIRSPDDRKRLISLIEDWKPFYSLTYHPGWHVDAYVSPDEYSQFISQAKQDTIREINRVAVLVGDDEYYRLHTEYVALLERVSKQEKQDPADVARIDSLQSAKMRRAAALGDPSAISASATKGTSATERSDQSHPKPALPTAARIVERPDDPVVKRCARAAKHNAVTGGGEVLRSVVVEEPEIGIVFRADLSDDSGGTTRFWCSERFTGSEPLASGLSEDIAPLPKSPR